ncbi:MAG: TIGR02281 family clan AA aspartic protease [Caulobacterales bacterium]|nr:TIGR02281 family clan AA aspartic protease [Caulobacterales bacterium]
MIVRFLSLAAVAALSATGAAKAVVSIDALQRDQAQTQIVATATAPAPQTAATVAAVARAGDGHYWAQADVNGKAVRFLVDTGATSVVLTATDAARLGLEPKELIYDRPVVTADGRTEAAAVVLDHLSIAGARVDKVEALVIAEGLEPSLPGMSYLGRLSRFEATPTALILRP